MGSLVSIIIPCYNAQPYVANAIQSALDQDYPCCEVIVIDDGSTDDSLNVIKGFGNRVQWQSGPNRGGSAARNKGISLASGEYVQFLDADDFMSRNKISQQVACLERSKPGTIATCAYRYCKRTGEPEPPFRQEVWHSYPHGTDLLVDTWNGKGSFPIHSWLVPSSLIRQSGNWNERLTGDDDGEFSARVLLIAGAVTFVEDAVAFYRRPGPTNVSKARRQQDIQSWFEAWDSIQSKLLAKRKDREASLAVLRRLRSITYFYGNQSPDWIKWAARREKAVWRLDWNYPIPRASALLIAFCGLSLGLQLRSVGLRFKNVFRNQEDFEISR